MGVFVGMVFVLVVEDIVKFGFGKFSTSFSLLVIGIDIVFIWYFKRSMKFINGLIDEMTDEKEIIKNGKRLSGKNPDE